MKQKKFKKQTKTMWTNIYVSTSTKNILDELQERYKASYSAMATFTLEELPIMEAKIFQDQLLDKQARTRTQIKSKFFIDHIYESAPRTNLASNALYLLANQIKPLGKLYNSQDKEINRIYNKILNKLEKSKERYWDFNNSYRTLIRARKQYERDYNK